MRISLSSSHWQFRGHWPHTPLFGRSMETGAPMGAVTRWMPATVPGCVINDLIHNGVIEDPYYERNSLMCEWVENRWWVYKTEFTLDDACRGQDIALVFLGVDYRCHIFLNGQKLMEHEGMVEPIRLDIAAKARFGAPNELEVVLESPPDEMGQIGYTSRVRTQTSRFGYKWDYGTRLVHSGIWQDVYLEITPGARIENTHVTTSLDGQAGIVDVALRLKLASGETHQVVAELKRDEMTVSEQCIELDLRQYEEEVKLSLTVENPALWWPNGYGAQPLYDLSVRLMRGGALCDSHECRVGVRSLAYEQNEGAADALPYVVVINGTPIYIRGFNISPLDHMIGSIPSERYRRTLALARAANANMIRVWGGGITETELFYRLCDELGILVWQEFNQSSSGIDNIPPTDEAFLKLLKANATASVLGRRNHVCLAYWGGGNELMDADGVPVTYGDVNIAMLKELADALDPQRLFLPTSASGPREFLDVTPEGLGNNHDVHGPWQYQGPARHYEMYNRSDSLFHSEFGADGFTNLSAARRFLSEKNLVPGNVRDNLTWRHHGEWWDTTERDRALFGKLQTLDRMIAASQFIQAEGLRYAVESNRRRAFQNCGSIIWQLNEPWPNLFNTCLLDYYYNPKAAYWWVGRAYAKLAVSLRYDRLTYEPGSVFHGEVWVSDNACTYDGAISYRVLNLNGQVHQQGSFIARCDGRHSVCAGSVSFAAEGFSGGYFLIELMAEGLGDPNQYLFSSNGEPAFATLFNVWACPSLQVEEKEGGVLVENRGDVAALLVRLECEGAAFESNGFHLMPGETRLVRCGGKAAAVTVDWLNRC